MQFNTEVITYSPHTCINLYTGCLSLFLQQMSYFLFFIGCDLQESKLEKNMIFLNLPCALCPATQCSSGFKTWLQSSVFVCEPHVSLALEVNASFERHSCVYPSKDVLKSIFTLPSEQLSQNSTTKNGEQYKKTGDDYYFILLPYFCAIN